MYAIVETCGKQYRVMPGRRITVDRLAFDEGATVTLEKVLLIGGDSVRVGSPTVAGATVEARVVSHSKGDKCITFKYLHRRRSRRRVGFRHSHTTLEIVGING